MWAGSYGGPLGCRAGSGSQVLSHCPSQERGSWGHWERDVSLGTGWVGDRLGYRPMGWPGSAVSMAGQGWAVGSWSLALLGPCWGRGCQPWSDVGSGAGGRASLGISRDSVAWQCPQAPHTFTPPHSPSKLLSYFPPSCCLSWLLTCRG